MYQTEDGKNWSKIMLNNAETEMLWDSGASVTFMSKNLWEKIGKPELQRSMILLCRVSSTGGE